MYVLTNQVLRIGTLLLWFGLPVLSVSFVCFQSIPVYWFTDALYTSLKLLSIDFTRRSYAGNQPALFVKYDTAKSALPADWLSTCNIICPIAFAGGGIMILFLSLM